uniref:Uncharacterized protein n=1 Tax=Medicago truncatula TaxID=3880 RepID=I3T3B2_MEDTR|nr:unknown [Medicago truncatula]
MLLHLGYFFTIHIAMNLLEIWLKFGETYLHCIGLPPFAMMSWVRKPFLICCFATIFTTTYMTRQRS